MEIKIFKLLCNKTKPLYERVFEGKIECRYKTVDCLVNQLNTEGHLLLRTDTIEDGDVIYYGNSYLRIKQDEFSPVYYEKLSSEEASRFEYEQVFTDADLVDVLCIEPFVSPFKTCIKDMPYTDYIGDIVCVNGVSRSIKIYYNKNSQDIVNREYKGIKITGVFFVCEVVNGNVVSISKDVSKYFHHLFKDYYFPFSPSKNAKKNTICILDDEEVMQYV